MIKRIYSNYLTAQKFDASWFKKNINTMDLLSHTFHCLSFVTVLEGRGSLTWIYQGIFLHWTIWSPICINASCLWRERSLFEAAFYSARRRETVSKGLNAPYMWLFKRLRSEQKARSTLIINYLSYINWEAAYLFAFQKKHCACHAAHYLRMIIRIRRKPWWWRSRRWWAPYCNY